MVILGIVYYSQIPKILKVIYYLITNYNKLFIFHFFFLSFTQHNFSSAEEGKF